VRTLRWLIVAAVLAGAAVFHPWLLTQAAAWLVAPEPRMQADCLAVLDGDRCFPYAATQYETGSVEQVLLIEDLPGRLVRLGVLPSRMEVGTRELERLGVPSAKIGSLAAPSRDEWAWVRELQRWLAAHPEVSVALVCDAFHSAYWQCVLDRTLTEPERGRVAVHPLRDRRYDETNWWKKRTGLKDCWSAVVDWVYMGVYGEDRPVQLEWDPDAYERALAL
jgi:hypothetical protein